MSIEAVHWALGVPIGGNAKVVLLGLANHAHPDGSEAYPSLDRLAIYANCDRSTARRNVNRLVELGWIIPDGQGPRRQNCYRLAVDRRTDLVDDDVADPLSVRDCVYCGGDADVMDHVVPRSKGGRDAGNRVPACIPCNAGKSDRDVREWVGATGRDWDAIAERLRRWGVNVAFCHPAIGARLGVASEALRVAPVPPEPSIEPSTTDLAGARERADALPSVSYRGKRVDRDVVALAVRLLDAFNAATGRGLGATTAAGNPSPAVRQIVGALLLRDDIDPHAWQRAVRNTVANPPGWLEGRPIQLGDIFGERAVSHALANTGLRAVAALNGASAVRGAEAERQARQARRAAIARGEVAP